LIRQRTLRNATRPAAQTTARPTDDLAPAVLRVEPDARATAQRDAATLLAEALLPAFAGASVLIWLIMLRWYDLGEKYAIPYFAFEKVPGQFHSTILHRTLALFIGGSLLYIAGCLLIARARRMTRLIKVSALAFMAGPGVVNIFLYPAGALDVFNYMVDLKLAYHYGDNPYVVTNPPFIVADPISKSAFLLNVPLFYGPAWLLFSGIPALFTGFDDVVHLLMALKAFNLLLLALTALLIARAQPTVRRRWLAAFLFLANPLIVFEGVGNAHNDVMMTLFLVAAIYAMRQPRGAWVAAPALALSALVKLFTLAVAPLFLVEAIKRRWNVRQYALGLVVTVAVAIGVIAPFWDGGDLWTGMREGTRLSQLMDHVSPLSLAQQRLKQEIVDRWPSNAYLGAYASSDVVPQDQRDRLHRQFTIVFAASALLVIAARARNLVSFERATALTLILFSLLMTNLYPWYLIPIVALLAFELKPLGIAYIFAGTLLGLCYYPAYVWGHFNSGWPKLSVHLFLADFLTAPMVAFLLLEVARIAHAAYLQRTSRSAEPEAVPA
jgi:hypothetical protein